MPSRSKRSRRQPTVEGRRSVIESLRSSRPIDRIMMAKRSQMGTQMVEIVKLAEKARIAVESVDRRILEQFSLTGHHQGVIALVSDTRYTEIDELLAIAAAAPEPALLIILDGIQDPHNFGAIARSVDTSGVHGLIIRERRAAGISPGAIRASAGALEHIPVVRATNLIRTIKQLKDAGLWIVGMDPNASDKYNDLDLKSNLAIVIGSEGKGISRLVLECCDTLASVPLLGKIESLNASVTAAIALYEAVRQRSIPPTPS